MSADLTARIVELLAAAALSTAVVMGLVVVVLVARSILVPTGEARIRVNGADPVRTDLGRTLLAALADHRVILPAACGGKGTCGLCRVRVEAGGGAPRPLEHDVLTRQEASAGVRLACQVVVRQDLAVVVPPEVLGAKEIECVVRTARDVSTFIREIALDLPPGTPFEFRAGQFVQVTCPPFQASFAEFDIDPGFKPEWERLGLLRLVARAAEPTTRAYSLANFPGEPVGILLNVRIATPPPNASGAVPPGVVSSYLFSLRAGARIGVSGPFGDFLAEDSEREMVFVGGGAGMAPLRSHIFDQLERRRSSRRITFWYGARSRRELFYAEDFERLAATHGNFRWHAALSEPKPDDDWCGATGFIHQVLHDRYLRDHPAPEDCEYYLCGPPLMIRATRTLLDDLGVPAENVHFDDFGGERAQ